VKLAISYIKEVVWILALIKLILQAQLAKVYLEFLLNIYAKILRLSNELPVLQQ